MKKIAFCILMLAMVQVSRVFVWAQTKPAAPVGVFGAPGPGEPVARISGICGVAVGGDLPLDEFQKSFRWKIIYSVKDYRSDDVYHREAIHTQAVQPTGYFRLDLPPGKYTLVPQSDWAPEAGGPHPVAPQAQWMTVEVEANKFTVVTIHYGGRR